MVPLIAIPVLHSSGAWIASTAASGYIAGTISGTWVGAFILGNAGWLGSLGLVSTAGWVGTSGAVAGMAASTGAMTGGALSAIGLGGFAKTLGLIPVTFLGLTPVGWAVSATGTMVGGGIGYLLTRKVLKRINAERMKGDLDPISVSGILSEIHRHNEQSKIEIFKKASKGHKNWQMSLDEKKVSINDEEFPMKRAKFVVDKDQTARFVVLNRLGRIIRTFRINPTAI